MSRVATSFSVELPHWLPTFISSSPTHFSSAEERVRLAVELAKHNVVNGTGGPFGAAIFELDSGKLVGVGVNRVVPGNCSIAHAEMMAFATTQNALQTFDLGSSNLPNHQLATSAAMCAMCLGATVWSGVKSVLISARKEDVESLTGFDEGPVHPTWAEQLVGRGIAVTQDVIRDEGRKVLQLYSEGNGVVYNGRSA
jgi:tRNA(Arg) A34 adenosine deaminase TadA